MRCLIDALRLELCCLAKPYFREEDFLVAELDGRFVGFLHLGPLGNEQLTDAATDMAAISAFCIEPHADEASIAAALLGRALAICVDRHVNACRFKPMLPNCPFYVGLGPADSIIGTTSAESRVCSWLGSAGFEPLKPTSAWELEMIAFHAPVDRVQIQIRRSAHVDRQIHEPLLPWWQACMLGHTEPTAFQLTHRKERRVLNEVLFWSVAPELQTLPDSVFWLWPPTVSDEDAATDQLVFLLAESLRQLQSERVDLVRTVAGANENDTSNILKRLGFTPTQSGVVFEKTL